MIRAYSIGAYAPMLWGHYYRAIMTISCNPNISAITKSLQKRLDIMAFVRQFILDNNYPPTGLDIGRALSLSNGSAWHHINVLVEDGQLEKTEGSKQGRALWIPGLEPPEPPKPVPVYCQRCGVLANLSQNDHGDWICQTCVAELDGKFAHYWHRVPESRRYTAKAAINGKVRCG